jgi:hypothetical protein
VRELDRSRLFKPSPLTFVELAHEGREARIMVFIVESSLVPSLEGSLHRKVKDATRRASLETYAFDNLSVIGARWVFQKEVIFEEREVRRDP